MAIIRGYVLGDLLALYDICLTTDASGQDATALHSDPELIEHIYAVSYGVLEPDLVLVAEDELGVAGYIVGTFDSNGLPHGWSAIGGLPCSSAMPSRQRCSRTPTASELQPSRSRRSIRPPSSRHIRRIFT
ncbi:MAG: hypothetical protein MO846_03740 [Candidatus Devosia symbiotica]|nr:hypothetical protein [Candidatus Devosia symbiotica]